MAIADTLVATPPPLRLDESGTLRVGNTRVTLDLVLRAHEQGLPPEEIVRRYDTLCLAEVYAAIGYALAHREEVAAYLAERETQADVWRRFWQERCPTEGLKEQLRARRPPSDPPSEEP
jgi:uncharacterized protein (DUF433 family)